MKYTILMIAAALTATILTGCIDSSDQKQNREQEQLSSRAVDAAGMPAITNFQEKKNLKMILELRDKEISTYSYTQDLNGQLHLLCKSIGYGIPYATQYTNPQRVAMQGLTVPQADPNGLFSPASADGTWVLCFDPASKNVSPVLVEPRLIVSPFELHTQ